MDTRVLEVRDRGTKIFVLCSKPGGLSNGIEERVMVAHCGYRLGNPTIIVTKLSSIETLNDAYNWNDRTMYNAHIYIEKNFDNLKDGDVVDVEFILGETDKPKEPEWKKYLVGGF